MMGQNDVARILRRVEKVQISPIPLCYGVGHKEFEGAGTRRVRTLGAQEASGTAN